MQRADSNSIQLFSLVLDAGAFSLFLVGALSAHFSPTMTDYEEKAVVQHDSDLERRMTEKGSNEAEPVLHESEQDIPVRTDQKENPRECPFWTR